MRYQLVTLEAENTVGRALKGKKVFLPEAAKNVQATMSWGGDVAKMIARLLFNEKAKRETYSVTTSEHHTWGEIAEYYREIMGMEVVWGDSENYIESMGGGNYIGKLRQLKYDRLYDRVIDNSKVLAHTGMKAEELMPLYDGLKYEIGRVPEGYDFCENPSMDKILKKYE